MSDFLTGPLAEPFMQRSLAVIAMLAIATGVVGTWMILYGYSYAGESMAHTAFPGVALAAIAGAPVIVGGIPAVALAGLSIGWLAGRDHVDRDTAVAGTVIGFFGIGGLVALSPDLGGSVEDLLFGDLLAASDSDLMAAGIVAASVLAAHALLRGRLLAVGFSPTHAASMQIKPRLHEAVLLLLLALTVLVTVQALGNLLAIAFLVAPAAASLASTKGHAAAFPVAIGLGALAGVVGLYLSYHAGTAAGASVAIVALAIYAAVAVAPNARPPKQKAAGAR